MVFSSALFLFAFFPAFLICALATAKANQDIKNFVLIFFSLLFYVFGGGIYTLILISSIGFNWLYGWLVIERFRRSAFLFFGTVVNLIPLIVFKYFAFLSDLTAKYFFKPFLDVDIPILQLFLPVGISFYTFQAIAYLFDIHRGEHPAERKLSVFSAYMLMFPQLVAGPIVRFAQIRESFYKSKVTLIGLNAGLFFFGVGLAKKMLIADPIGAQVDMIYEFDPSEVTSFMAWFAAIGYYLQIFFDFSGYSEMAIGIGLMVGFSFPENFRQPYRSVSITEFWRRWHITLSSWFRDYLYIPMGGNRAGTGRTLANLSIVFVLCGLWHGAALTFLVWGAFHGLLLVIERILKRSFNFVPTGFLGFAVTTLLVTIGWVLFRSVDFAQAHSMLTKMFFLESGGVSTFGATYFLTPYMMFTFGVGLIFALIPSETWHARARVQDNYAAIGGAIGLVLVFLSAASLAARGFNPFIYFQF